MKKQAGSGRNAAVIVAAGFGKRMDGNIPKQYICIGGKPVLIHSIENFERASGISEIILVVEKSRVEEILKDIVEQYEHTLLPVGADLSDSIRVFGKQAIQKATG